MCLSGKARQVFLKKSLGTKDLEGRERAWPSPCSLGSIGRLVRPQHSSNLYRRNTPSLNATEIARMAEYVFAKLLAWDERFRVGGREEFKRLEVEVRQQLAEGEELQPWRFLSRRCHRMAYPGSTALSPRAGREAWARCGRLWRWATSRQSRRTWLTRWPTSGSISPRSPSYPALGIAVFALVRALQAVEQRNIGEPIDTPKLAYEPLRDPRTAGRSG